MLAVWDWANENGPEWVKPYAEELATQESLEKIRRSENWARASLADAIKKIPNKIQASFIETFLSTFK